MTDTDTTTTIPKPHQLHDNENEDAAFEAFASCRFGEAARLAAGELIMMDKKEEEEEEEGKDAPPLEIVGAVGAAAAAAVSHAPVLLPCPAPAAGTEEGGNGRIVIELSEYCARYVCMFVGVVCVYMRVSI